MISSNKNPERKDSYFSLFIKPLGFVREFRIFILNIISIKLFGFVRAFSDLYIKHHKHITYRRLLHVPEIHR